VHSLASLRARSLARRCPFCKRAFEYGPSDYHRKRICGNAGCDREFGFMQHPVSARRL